MKGLFALFVMNFRLVIAKSTLQISGGRSNILQVPCVASLASVSVRFRSKERGTRVKDSSSCFISRAVKTENPVPRVFFAPKLNGNACYAGYMAGDISEEATQITYFESPDSSD